MWRYVGVALGLGLAVVAGCGDDDSSGGVEDTSVQGDVAEDTTPADDVSDTDTEEMGPCAGLGDGEACDDGDACTTGTTCDAGECTGGSALVCEATEPCVESACDSTMGCVPTPSADGASCELACFSTSTCVSGACVGDEALDCPVPDDPCVAALTCSPETGACDTPVATAAGATCNADDDVCTLDRCDGAGACVTESTDDCSALAEADPCQVFGCDATDGCVATGPAVDGTPCGNGQICTAGECVLAPCAVGCGDTLACPTLSAGATAPDDIRSGPMSLVVDGAIHVLGGSPFFQHLIFTPGGGWTAGTPLADGVREGGGAVIGDLWYLVDGDEDEGVRIYNPQSDAWILGAARPASPARGPAVGSNGTDLFVAGGADGNLNGGTATHRYAPATDTWTSVAPMPTARGFIAHAVVGDRLFAFGGRDKAATGSSILDTAEAYDMASDTWTTLTPMPTARNSAFAAAVGNFIVVAGGFNGSSTVNTIEIYDTVSDTWETCSTSMSSSFSAGTAAALDGVLYLFGGGSSETGVEVGTF